MIRPEVEADADAIATVVEAAFGEPAEAVLVRELRASEAFIPELSLVAVADDEVVGHVMITTAHVDGDGGRFVVGNLSPLAVAPPRQRRGIGTALVEQVLRGAAEVGLPLVVVEGDPRYYRRFGFEWSVPLGITIDLPAWAPAEAAQVFRLPSYDAAIRGRVTYPAPFEALESG